MNSRRGSGWSLAQRKGQGPPSAGRFQLSVDPPPAVEKSRGRGETADNVLGLRPIKRE